jgi:RNA polymerase primary sigma factor
MSGAANAESTSIDAAEAICAAIAASASGTVSYDAIEAQMARLGRDPAAEPELYEAVIARLESAGLRVVEEQRADEPTPDTSSHADAADETLRMLDRVLGRRADVRHPILTAAQERRLLEIYHDGRRAAALRAETAAEATLLARRRRAGERALAELVRCNLRLVVQQAVRRLGIVEHLDLEDLVQEGRMGLIRAIERFEIEREGRLSTYAVWWIRQSIGRLIADHDRTVRLPVHVIDRLWRTKRQERAFVRANGRPPTEEELAAETGQTVRQLRTLRRAALGTTSLDRPGDDESDLLLGDLLPSAEPLPDERVAHLELRRLIDGMLSEFKTREREVIRRRFGLDDDRSETLEQVAEGFGVTRERIRQIESKVLLRLRHPSRAGLLVPFWNAEEDA